MGQEAIKLELIKWLSDLTDAETIEYLQIVKDSRTSNQDWWNELTPEQREGIERGLKDVEEGRTISHEDIVKKYGL